MTDKKKFPLTVAPLWESKYGGYYTYVKDEAFDNLQKIEKGGMLSIKVVKAESRTKETSPHAYLEFTTKEDMAAKVPKPPAGRTAAPSDDI